MNDFLNAFYGLSPWDAYFDIYYFDKLLIDKAKKPKDLIYTKK
jgi:hypothetical protein